MVNGFLLALLTNRTFFIDYPLHERFFTHALDFSWARQQARLPAGGGTLLRELKYEQPFGSDFYLTTDFGAPEWLAKDIIEINCDGDYEAAPLLSNRLYAPFRDKYFPSGEVFHPLAQWLLRTKPDFQERVDAVRKEHFRPFTIGLQIRKWKGHGEGGFNWAPPPSIKAFASAAKALQRQRGLPDKDVAFFIASDASEVYEEAARELGAEQVGRTLRMHAPARVFYRRAHEHCMHPLMIDTVL
jgi:xyloglucan fucosyltransferase